MNEIKALKLWQAIKLLDECGGMIKLENSLEYVYLAEVQINLNRNYDVLLMPIKKEPGDGK